MKRKEGVKEKVNNFSINGQEGWQGWELDTLQSGIEREGRDKMGQRQKPRAG